MRLCRRGVYPALDAGLLAMTKPDEHPMMNPDDVTVNLFNYKHPPLYPQNFVANLPISVFRSQSQAGSLCYSASAFHPRASVAHLKNHRIPDSEMTVVQVYHIIN